MFYKLLDVRSDFNITCLWCMLLLTKKWREIREAWDVNIRSWNNLLQAHFFKEDFESANHLLALFKSITSHTHSSLSLSSWWTFGLQAYFFKEFKSTNHPLVRCTLVRYLSFKKSIIISFSPSMKIVGSRSLNPFIFLFIFLPSLLRFFQMRIKG